MDFVPWDLNFSALMNNLPTDWSIRPASPADHQDWLEMRRELWPNHDCHNQDIDAYFSGSDPQAGRVWIAHCDGSCIGFIEAGIRDHAQGCLTSPVAYIEGWYVRKEWRRIGVGRSLVEAVENWADKQSLSEIASDCLIDNRTSAAAHESCGFIETTQFITFKKKLG